MFYHPITTEIERIPIIIYPCPGIEHYFSRSERGSLEQELTDLYSSISKRFTSEKKVLFHLDIMWEDGAFHYADIWSFKRPGQLWEIAEWEFGPEWSVAVFREGEYTAKKGMGCGNSLALANAELQHLKKAGSLEAFLKERPVLPEEIDAKEEFYR